MRPVSIQKINFILSLVRCNICDLCCGNLGDRHSAVAVLVFTVFIVGTLINTNNMSKQEESGLEQQLAGLDLKDTDLQNQNTSDSKKCKNEKSRKFQMKNEEGKFLELPRAKMGKVVVRFPPEASGYLHIGHSKAALLNQHYQLAFKGRLIMRFDDTNPAKEKEDFEKVILEDIDLLRIKPDRFTYTSDYFDTMLEMCENLLKQELAFVDDTEGNQMRIEREQRINSINRNNSIEKNLDLWRNMLLGTEIGKKCCVRAKINMNSANGCMRDPTIYRCKPEYHPRTFDKYKVYPTYDFACPIVDSIEGVTHSLRTTEYLDRDEQFYWFCDALKLGTKNNETRPIICSYSRLNMTNTVLSKRKLTWFVDQGHVDGWDDPRMPTVRGVLRRGMQIEALKQFIMAQGSSRTVTAMQWDKIWSLNRSIIDSIAPRHTALLVSNRNNESAGSPVEVLVENVDKPYKINNVPKHPKNAQLGLKNCVWATPKILIDYSDAELLKEGSYATFINWGNLLINRIERNQNNEIKIIYAISDLQNTDFKSTVKITWLPNINSSDYDENFLPLIPAVCVYFDHLISKPVLDKDDDFKNYLTQQSRWELQMLGDSELKDLHKGDVIQLQRKGFFICDSQYQPYSIHTGKECPVVLFNIPDGRTKTEMPINIIKSVTITATTSYITDESKQSADILVSKINNQGNLVRSMKSNNASKAEIGEAVKILLTLKAEYKNVTGTDFKPNDTSASQLIKSKPKQDKMSMESDGCTKTEMLVNTIRSATTSHLTDQNKQSVDILVSKINNQGNLVRSMKSNNASKAEIGEAVKILLALKTEYKNFTGIDFKPTDTSASQLIKSKPKQNKMSMESDGCTKTEMLATTSYITDESKQSADILVSKINNQGNLVRSMKSNNASKAEIGEAVKILLALKAEYKNVTGTDFKPGDTSTSQPIKSKPKQDKMSVKSNVASETKKSKSQEKTDYGTNTKKITKLGLEVPKVAENLGLWYSQVLVKGEMIEYYDVSGCYILRPWAFRIWELLKNWFDSRIKRHPLNVQNCYFPIFVSKSALEKEKDHISDFAPEVAWVTKYGDSDLAENIAIRPTSETVMYPAFSKWIQSYRDLPLKLNQWNNVVRWEFKHPQPFLRTREFLWQEGHHAYATRAEAERDVLITLDYYEYVYKNMLSVPVIKGKKTEKEKFAGGVFTTTCEVFIASSGRAIQGATSHYLGTNFARMFDVHYEDPDTHERLFVHQISYGMTTRTIGVMVMVHGDDRGLVLPPRVATLQVIIVPCGIGTNTSEEIKQNLIRTCLEVCNRLKGNMIEENNYDNSVIQKENSTEIIRADTDLRENYSPGWKFNHWELKGVPLRLELGPKDLGCGQIIAVRRDNGEKLIVPLDKYENGETDKLVSRITELLNQIQNDMLIKAQQELRQNVIIVRQWSECAIHLANKRLLLIPFCGNPDCEDNIKRDTAKDDGTAEIGASVMGAKSLCVPFEQPEGKEKLKCDDKCIHPECGKFAGSFTLFGRSY